MTETTKTAKTTDTTGTDQPKAGAASPLAARLSAEAAEARKVLAERFTFGSGGFTALADTAARAHDRFTRAGASERALSRCADARRVLADAARLLNQQGVEAVPPTNAEIYSAAMTVVRFEDISSLLGGPWNQRVLDWSDAEGDQSRPGPDRTRDRVILMFAAACKRGQIKTTPRDIGNETGNHVAATIDMNRWNVGVSVGLSNRVSDQTTTADGFAKAARDAGSALTAAGMPGLVLIEVTDALPDLSRASRVDSDTTGLSAMQSAIDRTLIDSRLDLACYANGLAAGSAMTADAPVFGLIASATMRSTIVSAVRVGFATLFRGVNLCELSDPRAERLAWFLERFSRA
jgi:hypothetical protein